MSEQPAAIENNRRFQALVDLRARARELAAGHLESLDRFRSAEFPGHPLSELRERAVSIPTFVRLCEQREDYDLRVSSTCSAVRSILRHPGADYGNLRPLHLLIEILARFELQESPKLFNIVQLGQLADLAELIQQAAFASYSSIAGVSLEDIELLSIRTEYTTPTALVFQRAIAECLNQFLRDLDVLHDGSESDELRHPKEALKFSLSRLERVCFLGSQVVPAASWKLSISGDESPSLFARIMAMSTLERSIFARTIREFRDGQCGGTVGTDAWEKANASIARRIVEWTLGTEGNPIARNVPRGERLESAFAASLVIYLTRDRINNLLRQIDDYHNLRIDAATNAHPYVLYWALAGLQTHRKNEDHHRIAGDLVVRGMLRQARHQYYRLLARAGANDSPVDAVRIGYHLALELEFNPDFDGDLARAALEIVRQSQTTAGSFLKVNRMWLAGSGDAYGSGIELLTTLLIAIGKDPQFLEIIEPCLERGLAWLESHRHRVGSEGPAWEWGEDAAGSPPINKDDEGGRPPAQAWVMGEAYSFLYLAANHYSNKLSQLAVELFAGRPRSETTSRAPKATSEFRKIAADFWRPIEDKPKVADVLWANVIRPLSARHRFFGPYILGSRANSIDLMRSGILFGPPGTGKTTLVEELAKTLGWPLITLGAYDFLKYGHDGVARAANEVFQTLCQLEDCVILFDEMEEFMRSRVYTTGGFHHIERTSSERDMTELCIGTDSGPSIESEVPYVQRLWTTIFLPLLQRLHDEAKVIFVVATNHFHRMDSAIVRPGRFDFRIHVLPPSPRRKIVEILLPELRTQFRLSEGQRMELEGIMANFLMGRHWLVRRDGIIEVTYDAMSEEEDYLECDLEMPDGSTGRGALRVDLRFLYFTMADTRSFARAIRLHIAETRTGEDEVDLDEIRSAALHVFPEIVPSAFAYTPGLDYLRWSRLRNLTDGERTELARAR